MPALILECPVCEGDAGFDFDSAGTPSKTGGCPPCQGTGHLGAPFDGLPDELLELGLARFNHDPQRLTPLSPLEEQTRQALMAALARRRAA